MLLQTLSRPDDLAGLSADLYAEAGLSADLLPFRPFGPFSLALQHFTSTARGAGV